VCSGVGAAGSDDVEDAGDGEYSTSKSKSKCARGETLIGEVDPVLAWWCASFGGDREEE
jgi:hypothetical protein